MTSNTYHQSQLHELLYQALETGIGGIQVHETALACAVNDDLRKQWGEYLAQTRTHRKVLLGVFAELGLDPDAMTPGRKVVGHIGASLVRAMQMARAEDSAEAAQRVAGECVVLAKTKDHMNWELIGRLAAHGQGDETAILKAAHEAVGQEEDHTLHRTTGCTRELWIESLGLPAVLPPPEVVRQVRTAIGAAHAGPTREQMLRDWH